MGIARIIVVLLFSFCISCGKNYYDEESASFKVKLQISDSEKFENSAGGSPASANVTFLAIYGSPNADCSEVILLQEFNTGRELDLFSSNLAFFSNPNPTVFECIIIKIKDRLTFKANALAVNLHSGCQDSETNYSKDLYHKTSLGANQWRNPEGETIQARGTETNPVTDEIFLFASTNTTQIRANGNTIPSAQKWDLGEPFQVPGTLILSWDILNKVDNLEINQQNFCILNDFEISLLQETTEGQQETL